MVVLVCVAVVVDGDSNNTSSRVYAGKMIFQLRQKLSWIKKKRVFIHFVFMHKHNVTTYFNLLL